jgi:hypothetical protein
MSAPIFLRIALAALGLTLSWPSAGLAEGKPEAPSIPFDQLGAEAQKQYKGGGIGIVAADEGAVLRGLEGETHQEGLWLTSEAEASAAQAGFPEAMA